MIKKILLISTGGTIAGEVASNRRSRSMETVDAIGLSELLLPTILSLKETRDIEVLIEPYQFSAVDSTDIGPEHWTGLADLIREKYDGYDAFVIVHGTNTLGYTCAALSFALHNNAKPVVVTGSQVPINMLGSDAKANLDNAVRIACWDRHLIHGVIAVFGSHIISGTRVKKFTEFDYDAFNSFNTSSVGRIGRIVDINRNNLERHNDYLSTAAYRLATKKSQLVSDSRFLCDIASLTEFPGMNSDVFRVLVDNIKVKGFILRAFGAGDAAIRIRRSLEALRDLKIPVVITTQAPNGNANMQVNEPGKYIKERMLGIPAFDMGIEALTTKLAWLLARKESGEINYEQLCEMMIVDQRGEIRVLWEDESE